MSLTVDTAIAALGGTGAVSEALGVPPSTVSTWKARRFIPARRWPAIVQLAGEKGCDQITFEALAALPSEPVEGVSA